MAETLGSLCDKLTIVKLKQFHTKDEDKRSSLLKQETQLVNEINQYWSDAISGKIQIEKLNFASNKIYKEQGNEINSITGNLGSVFAELAKVNCDLWHEQEKVYDFEAVPAEEKNMVVKKLATLNLSRNQCIDKINLILTDLCHK